MYADLRRESAERLVALDFPGYAIGGLAVGEPAALRDETIEHVEPFLPAEKPRYLMGVGTPADLVDCVALGVDMFDCVMPTRHARNGWLFTEGGHIAIKHTQAGIQNLDAPYWVPACAGMTAILFLLSPVSAFRDTHLKLSGVISHSAGRAGIALGVRPWKSPDSLAAFPR